MLSEKITHLCKIKGTNLRAVCQAAGLKYSTLHAQITNGRAIPFTTVDKLARVLNVPLTSFSDSQPVFQIRSGEPAESGEMLVTLERNINAQTKALTQEGRHISIDDVLDWLAFEDFKLVNDAWISDQIDLFHRREPDERIGRPFKLGPQSLASQFLGVTDENYAEHLARLDNDLIERVSAAHDAIVHRHYSVTDQAIDVTTNGERVRGSYRRLLAGVEDANGTPFTLVFCRLIRFTNG